MSPARTSMCLLASTGLLLVLAPAPAQAAATGCPTGAQAVATTVVNTVYEGPLWAPLDQAAIDATDRDGDGQVCVRVVSLPSEPPGLMVPAGESNVLILLVDTRGGGRG